jgi:hypothetical protein
MSNAEVTKSAAARHPSRCGALAAVLLAAGVFAGAAAAHPHPANQNYSVFFPTGAMGGSITMITGIGPPPTSSILHARIDLTFQAQGTPADDVTISVEAMVNGAPKTIVVTGAMLGFPAATSGTYSGAFATDALNGLVTGFPGFPSSILDIHLYADPGGGIHGAILAGKVTVVANSSLTADVPSISLTTGGIQSLGLNAGPAHAGATYLLLGSISGTQPGIAVPGGALPLQPDPWFFWTLSNPNSVVLQNSFGALDGAGSAQASFLVPPATAPGLVGLVFHHAYVVLDGAGQKIVQASIPVGLELEA